MSWLLHKDLAERIEESRRLGADFSQSRNYQNEIPSPYIDGKTMVIPIAGILTDKFDFFAAIFGGGNTTYRSVIGAVNEANTNANVADIELRFDYSPGGNSVGLFPAMDTIRNSGKKVTAYIRDGAMSAAYGLASQADKIVALHDGVEIGSIGVAAEFRMDKDRIQLTNTDSPSKRPDLDTEYGKKVIVDELDEMFDVFADKISLGRNTTKAIINKKYGNGRVMLAKSALEAGMIDGIGIEIDVDPEIKEVTEMDEMELRAKFPALYQSLVDKGANAERERVLSHLVLADASGAIDKALDAIKEGKHVTELTRSEHLSIAMQNMGKKAMVNDNPDIPKFAKDDHKTDKSDMVLGSVASLLGLEVKHD